MPIPSSAERTGSSFSSLIMASIFFMAHIPP
jgi:hypothetical protein